MSWHYLQEPVEESSAACCLGGEPWQPSKLKNTHAPFCCNGRLTDDYLDSLSGTMCEHLTESRGAEKLMSSRADSLARIFPPLEKALAYQAKEAASGRSLLGLLAKYDQDSHSLRTAQCSLFEDSTESLQTLPRWGTMRNGVCWERTMSVRHTKETVYGYLPTPDSSERGPAKVYDPQAKSQSGRTLQTFVSMFPTPTCADGAQGAVLNDDTDIYFLNSGMPRKRSKQGVDGSVGLSRFVAIMDKRAMWPTPRSGKTTNENPESWQKRHDAGKVATPPLGLAVKMFPTPKNRDWKGKSQRGNYGNTTDCLPNAVSGQLNPDWVELLMGWPLGWTDITQPCHNSIPAWPEDWEGDTPRVTTKTPHRVERLKAIGNGQVPAVAACAFVILLDRFCQPPGAAAR